MFQGPEGPCFLRKDIRKAQCSQEETVLSEEAEEGWVRMASMAVRRRAVSSSAWRMVMPWVGMGSPTLRVTGQG